jgi:cysteine desulfurase
MIYLDNNATTRVLDEVVDAMRPYLTEKFANPASAIGQFMGLDRVIAAQKSAIADVIGAETGNQMIVTSGATESNNLAILGSAKANPNRRHIIVSAIEHPSVLEVGSSLEKCGYRVSVVPVNRSGVVVLDRIRELVDRDTLLVSVMLANNETGVIQPVAGLAHLIRNLDPEVIIHTDATQAAGKISIDLCGELAEVDLLSLSAHKFHGPKGVGVLFVRDPQRIAPMTYGGGQQFGIRPGTESPAALVGMASALRAVSAQNERYLEVRELRDIVEKELGSACAGAFALGRGVNRLPTTLNMCFSGLEGDHLVDQLAARGVAVSTGSACAHGAKKPSHVATAMGLSHEEAQSCIRISLSCQTSDKEIHEFVRIFTEILRLSKTPLPSAMRM